MLHLKESYKILTSILLCFVIPKNIITLIHCYELAVNFNYALNTYVRCLNQEFIFHIKAFVCAFIMQEKFLINSRVFVSRVGIQIRNQNDL